MSNKKQNTNDIVIDYCPNCNTAIEFEMNGGSNKKYHIKHAPLEYLGYFFKEKNSKFEHNCPSCKRVISIKLKKLPELFITSHEKY